MISIEKLEPERYSLLKAFPDQFVPDPKTSLALGAFDNEQLIGRGFLLQPVHIEGPFVQEAYRGHRIGFRIMQALEAEARKAKMQKVFAYATDDLLGQYLMRMNYKHMPMTVWAKEL